MKYDFDKLTDRRGRNAVKWDVAEGELPMWVADMDFEAPPAVRNAIEDVAHHGIYGYSSLPDEYFAAVSDYYYRRHGYRIPTEEMVYSSGVVAAISSLVRKLTTPAENVLIQAPVYNIFYNSILNNGRNVLSSDLVCREGRYYIDFDDLEAKLAMPQTSLMILCNPHNPVGRIWTREELARIGELASENGVTVISDEIHCDFTAPGKNYIPFASVNDLCRRISVTCVSPSKTFNIAGLQSACVFANDKHLRHKAFRGINTDEVGEPNIFAVRAAIAAYSECDEWVDEIRDYVFENKRIACKYIRERIPSLKSEPSDATYLLWINVKEVEEDSSVFVSKLRSETGLYLNDGAAYGECGRGFVRLNTATQRSRLIDGLERLEAFVNDHKKG